MEQWILPRNAELEEKILGEQASQYHGLLAELHLEKKEDAYIVRVRTAANPNPPFPKQK